MIAPSWAEDLRPESPEDDSHLFNKPSCSFKGIGPHMNSKPSGSFVNNVSKGNIQTNETLEFAHLKYAIFKRGKRYIITLMEKLNNFAHTN